MSKYIDGVNEENMDTFLKALRSGVYPQTTGTLCELDNEGEVVGYCCLGVGSQVAYEVGAVTKEGVDAIKYGGQKDLAPVELLDWLGIPEDNRKHEDTDRAWNIKFYKSGLENEEYEHVTATELNDDYAESFKTIADVFENEFKKESV